MKQFRTLDPSRMEPSDFMDISFMNLPSIGAVSSNNVEPKKVHADSMGFGDTLAKPLPSRTRGFLYYHPPMPNAPPAAGEVRFRLTTGPDPGQFASGVDLLNSDGIPWSIPLLRIARHDADGKPSHVQIYQALRQVLEADGLVTPALLRQCAEMHGAEKGLRKFLVHSLHQPFALDFRKKNPRLYVLCNDACRRVVLLNLFTRLHERKKVCPYLGERNTLVFDIAGTRSDSPYQARRFAALNDQLCLYMKDLARSWYASFE